LSEFENWWCFKNRGAPLWAGVQCQFPPCASCSYVTASWNGTCCGTYVTMRTDSVYQLFV